MKTTVLKGTYEDFLNNEYSDKEFHFRLLNPRSNSTYTDSTGRAIAYPRSMRFEATNVITELNQKGQLAKRIIRYIPGEPSIYKDEQSDDKVYPKTKFMVEFANGRKIISGTDAPLLQFMFKSNFNASNPNRDRGTKALFELVDNGKIVGEAIKNDKLRSEAAHFCYNGELNDVLAYARVLGVNINQRNDEIRYDLKVIADRNPALFLDNLKNPKMKVKHYVLTAIDEGYLVIRPENNSIVWATNLSQPICVAPAGKDIVDFFVLALMTTDGKVMLDAIIDMVKPSDSAVISNTNIPSKEDIDNVRITKDVLNPMLKGAVIPENELSDLVELGLSLGVITFKPPFWYKFRDKNVKSKDALFEHFRGNSEALTLLRHDIREKQ